MPALHDRRRRLRLEVGRQRHDKRRGNGHSHGSVRRGEGRLLRMEDVVRREGEGVVVGVGVGVAVVAAV